MEQTVSVNPFVLQATVMQHLSSLKTTKCCINGATNTRR
jgi:hypothetical protein